MENVKSLLGAKIREHRKKRNLTQEELASIVGIEIPSLSNIENGKNYPSIANLENILNILESSFCDAFDFEHKDSKENLLKIITEKLKAYPEKIEDFYKIVIALTK